MLAILNLLATLELVVLHNQLAVTYRKLLQAVFQALQFILGRVILGRIWCRKIVARKRLGLFYPRLLQPDDSGYAVAKGNRFQVLLRILMHDRNNTVERSVCQFLSIFAALSDK